jgi:hypothetical protein
MGLVGALQIIYFAAEAPASCAGGHLYPFAVRAEYRRGSGEQMTQDDAEYFLQQYRALLKEWTMAVGGFK